MHSRFAGLLCVVLLIGMVPLCQAGIFSGTIEKVAGNQITLKTTSGTSYDFKAEGKVPVTLDGKTTSLQSLKPGQQVSVFTNSSDQVTRVRARTEVSRPTPKPRPVKPKPDPGASSTTRPGPATKTAEAIWPQFRGPNRDNLSPDRGLLKEWPKDGPKPLWRAKGLGEGYSSVAIAGGLVLTMGNQGNSEAILAVDLKTGAPAWRAPIGPAFQQDRGNGPRGTPTVDGDRVYALGGSGQLACVELKNGHPVWGKNILNEFGAGNITWGISESVLIDGEKLICTPGGNDATLVALNKTNGEVIWKASVPGSGQAGYASPIVAEIDGVRQYIQFTSRAVVSVRASDGEFLWKNEASANGTANCSMPLVDGNFVFSASGYGKGGALLKLTSQNGRTSAEQVYHTSDMKNHHGGMVLVDGYLYGSNDPGILTCIDLKSGDVKWKDRSVGKGSVAYADGHLILRSENGPVALVEATPEGYREKGRFDQPLRSNYPSWSHPVIADGKLFLRDMDNLLVYDLRAK